MEHFSFVKKDGKNGWNRQEYAWKINGMKQVRSFLSVMLPYLRIKNVKAKQVIKEIDKNLYEKVIVFSGSREMCKILERELKNYNPLVIIGKLPVSNGGMSSNNSIRIPKETCS